MVPVTLSSTLFCGSRRSKSMQIRIHNPAPRFFTLKVQCHEIFDFWFFHESVSPKPLSIPLWPYRFFFENLRRYSQLKVRHRCHWYWWCTLTCDISANLRNNLKRSQWDTLGLGELIQEKNQKLKISWHSPYKVPCVLTENISSHFHHVLVTGLGLQCL